MGQEGTTVEYIGDPDDEEDQSLDVALHCPWCGIVSRVQTSVFHRTETKDAAAQVYTMAVCASRTCGRAVFLVIDIYFERFFDNPEPYPAKVYPAAEAQYAPDGVPKEIAKEFCEALECHWSGHHLGAALVGRRVLQAAARDVLGGKRNRLETEIADIPDDRLNKALKDQAHHVRLIGNDAAHVDPVDPEDVGHLLDFVEQVLDALYVGPAKVAKLDAKRAAIKAAKQAAPPAGGGATS